ncbi:MAG TPA: EAL domain-containing protein [Acidimicrobiales bacterium]|nr:EAL domain-containing protein [Acidimicrobiales bacterium]
MPSTAPPAGRLLRDLAVPAVTVGPDATCADIDGFFRRDEDLLSVVVRLPDGPGLIGRLWFEAFFTGTFGFGRALHARRPAAEIVNPNPVVLSDDTDVIAASTALLTHSRRHRDEDLVAIRPDGSWSTVGVSRVWETLAALYGHRALHDPLTGLANRNLLVERLELLLSSDRSGHRLAVVYCDIDRFKHVNDGLGHDAGDRLLVEVARRLEDLVRADDLVARVGGDEFVVLVLDDDPAGAAVRVAERIIDRFRAPVDLGEVSITADVSLGVASPPCDDVVDVETLLRSADWAMYAAKNRAGSAMEVTHRTSRPAEDLSLETGLRRALERGEIEVHYQPIVDLHDGTVRAVEALARWRPPVGPLIPPGRFIPVAEETGLIVPLGERVLELAVAELVSWRARLGSRAPEAVHVNLSPRQLHSDRLVDHVGQLVARSGLAPGALRLEMTESALTATVAAVRDRLLELRSAGVELGLDDFGAGATSLALLARLPFDEVKVDRSFVGRLDQPREAIVVRAVVELARGLGLRTTAEGIETGEQLATVCRLGCDLGQGYLLGRPTPAALVDLEPRALGPLVPVG